LLPSPGPRKSPGAPAESRNWARKRPRKAEKVALGVLENKEEEIKERGGGRLEGGREVSYSAQREWGAKGRKVKKKERQNQIMGAPKKAPGGPGRGHMEAREGAPKGAQKTRKRAPGGPRK
jgi:hypothetical protein